MNITKHKQKQEQSPYKYSFYLGSRERYIHIDSDFQSGNIQLVKQVSQFHYRLTCIDDGTKTNNKVNSKSWFYFSVCGFPAKTKGKFVITRLQTLMGVYADDSKGYRPVYRQCSLDKRKDAGWSIWNRVQTQTPLVLQENGQLQCHIQFRFKDQYHKVEFAFAYPYTYSQNKEFLNSLDYWENSQQFYFHKQILVRSPEGRDIHLLTITSHDNHNTSIQNEELFDSNLFPLKNRAKRFTKPVIFISARVHPGETASSFTLQGIINFLINNQDLRSFLLKKMFVFMVVPMINVDGVVHGNFRMDGFGKNLNRYYVDAQLSSQPAIYAIRELLTHLNKDDRLSFYFDLHAHNARKGAFIFGNAINDFVQQVQSQVFCKLFQMNNCDFQYEFCNFSVRQMNFKDRNQDRTKQGCGRVYIHKMTKIIHSYSLQCGIISASKNSIVPQSSNTDFKIQNKQLIEEDTNQQGAFFTQGSYRALGKSLLVSILDAFDKNPYNKVYNSVHKTLQHLRRVTAFQIFHIAQRFRMYERYIFGKVKNINELIHEVLNEKLHYKDLYNFYFANDSELKDIDWPQNIPGLQKPKILIRNKKIKSFYKDKTAENALVKDLDYQESKQGQKYQKAQLSNNKEIFQQQQFTTSFFSDSKYRATEISTSQQLPSNLTQSQGYNHFKNLRLIKKLNKLKVLENQQSSNFRLIKITQNQSPSVRVRRLLKQNTKKPKQETKIRLLNVVNDQSPTRESRQFLNNSSSFIQYSNKFTKNKPETKQKTHQSSELTFFQDQFQAKQKPSPNKRDKSKLRPSRNIYKPLENMHKQRIKSTIADLQMSKPSLNLKQKQEIVKFNLNKSSTTKIQLPAVKSHILIISVNQSKEIIQRQ